MSQCNRIILTVFENNESVTITVNPLYKVTISQEGSGDVLPPVGIYYHELDDIVPLCAENTGSPFVEWVINGISQLSSLAYLKVTGTMLAIAKYATDTVTLIMSKSGYCEISPSVGSHIYPTNTIVPITVTLGDTEQYIESIDGNPNPSNPYSVTMDVNKTVPVIVKPYIQELQVFDRAPVAKGSNYYFGDYAKDNDMKIGGVRVGTFKTTSYIQSNIYIIGKSLIDFTKITTVANNSGTKRLLLAGGDSNSNKGIYIYVGNGIINIFISDGVGRQQIVAGSVNQIENNKYKVIWNGNIGDIVYTYVNDNLLNATVASREWVGNSAITATVGSSSASIDGYSSYCRISNYFEYILNHGQGTTIFNLLGGVNGSLVGATELAFWGSTSNEAIPYDTVLGATLYRNNSNNTIMPICMNTSVVISGFTRIGYFPTASGALKGLPNTYNITGVEGITDGDYTADQIALFPTSDLVQITQDTNRVSLLKVRKK